MSNPNLKYQVHLSEEQRKRLKDISSNGHAPAQKIRHAQVLLMADQAHPDGHWTDGQISDALNMHVNSVARIRKWFVFEGEIPALNRRQRLTPPVPPKLDGEAHAHLVVQRNTRSNRLDVCLRSSQLLGLSSNTQKRATVGDTS